MSYGPVRMDFTPLGQIANSFFNARDQAIDRQLKQMQMSAPGDEAAIIAKFGPGGSPTPPANAQPGMVPLGQVGQNYNPQGQAPTFAGQPTQAASILKGFEGYRSKPYWDVNAYRIGYGSDTITDPATGQVRKVTPNDHIDQAMADADLMRRIPEFQRTAYQQTQAFGGLPQPVQAALTSVAYNYGSLPKTVVAAVNSGDLNQIASAVEALPANPGRRKQEAAIIRSAGGQGGTQTIPNLFQTSAAPPQDLPVPNADPAQFVIPGSGQAVPASGQPAPAGVTSPHLPVPPYIQALAASPNPYVRAKATELYLQYQQQQRQYDLEAWKMNAQAGLEAPYKQGTMEAQKATAAARQSQADTAAATLDWRKNQPVKVGDVLVDPNTKQQVFQAPNKPTTDMQEYDLYAQQAKQAGKTPDDFTTWMRANKQAGASQVNNIPAQVERQEDIDRANSVTKFLGGIADQAPTIAQRSADLDMLGRLVSRTATSRGAELKATLDAVGKELGLTDGKLATSRDAIDAITQRIAPTLRQAGSGSQSDTELRGFLSSLPHLTAVQGGNLLIMSTLKRVNDIERQRTRIAARWQAGKMTASDARSKIADLDEQSIYASPREKQIVEQLLGAEQQQETAPGWKIIGVE